MIQPRNVQPRKMFRTATAAVFLLLLLTATIVGNIYRNPMNIININPSILFSYFCLFNNIEVSELTVVLSCSFVICLGRFVFVVITTKIDGFTVNH